MTSKNYTLLDELPELEDLEHEKYNKYIRNHNKESHPESGMNRPYNQPAAVDTANPSYNPIIQQEFYPPVQNFNCLDVHSHITRCPICSKFFKVDNTVYIISIVILTIICILLLKKVLNL